jgi:hypothetical protein
MLSTEALGAANKKALREESAKYGDIVRVQLADTMMAHDYSIPMLVFNLQCHVTVIAGPNLCAKW